MSSPSISVKDCGRAFSFASILRQSYSVDQYRASACIVASCTPCVASGTVSRSGHLVALMRLRNSTSSASGTLTQNGRIAFLSDIYSLLCWGSSGATAVRVVRLRREVILGVISIWPTVFIFVFDLFRFSFLELLLQLAWVPRSDLKASRSSAQKGPAAPRPRTVASGTPCE